MTLGEYIKANQRAGNWDLTLRAHVEETGDVSFYIHPNGKDGVTMNFVIIGNTVIPDVRRLAQENDMKRLLQAAVQTGQSL